MTKKISYAQSQLYSLLSKMSGLNINQHTVKIESIRSVKHKLGNTEIVVTGLTSGFLSGKKVFYYNRSPMAESTNPIPICIKDLKLAWTTELVDLINEASGLTHNRSEIVNKRIGEGNVVKIDLVENHPIWTGSFKVILCDHLDNENIALQTYDIAKENVLPELASKLYAEHSFKEHADLLSKLKVGQTPPEKLVEILNSAGSYNWCMVDDFSKLNLRNSVVLYNGHSAKCVEAKLGDHMLIKIHLDSRLCTSLYGELLLYY